MKSFKKLLPLSLGVLAATASGLASAEGFDSVLADSKTAFSIRYRAESVDQDGKAEDALASTALARLTWTSGAVNGFNAVVEVDHVQALGAESYNNTYNGKTQYPVVADPTGTDINQAFVQYKGDSFTFAGGRQRINHNDQRFVGGVAWRQNEQTFDGYNVKYAQNALAVDYTYAHNVNRIQGEDSPIGDLNGDFHLFNTTYKVSDSAALAFFGYDLDFETAAAMSSKTFGVRYDGNGSGLNWHLSYAQQSETGDNLNNYDADYLLAELAGKLGSAGWTLGYEKLGSDNGVGFSTPLATGHKFQGFADMFLATPGAGVVDGYVSLSGAVGDVKLSATYHDFSSDQGSIDYGTEVDLTAAYAINSKVSTLLKFADYSADDVGVDVQKIWLMVQVTF